ncbi:MAG: hypothetical protein KDE51_16345 [Anaerolineales bacterium]|nr:hypothetical protein [Anaerolineales bacterium]
MKQASIVGILIIFLLAFLTSLGGVLFLWQEQGELQATAVAEGTAHSAAEATLVQVLAERQIEIGTQTAVAAEQAVQAAALEAQNATQEGLLAAVSTEMAVLQTAVARTPEAAVNVTPNLELQVRIWLKNPLTTRQVGQPIDIIASATHPEGIAALNIAVNGETLLADSPPDPQLHTVTMRYVPQTAGDYRLTAFATTARGRASQPVVINVTVIEGDDINSEIRRKIEAQVAEIRNLAILEPIFPTILNRSQLDQRLRESIITELDREELRLQSISLSAFDFVPYGYDLYEASLATLNAAVAGFYEPSNNEFVVVSDGDVMTQEEQLTFAHEFMHALQDQHYQLELLDQRVLSNDAAVALRALGEGEAELIEFLYQARGYLTGEELDEDDLLYGTPDFANVYDFLVDDFNFPYTRGYDFVSGLYEEGGFEAIDQAWLELPQSTEQILHPEKYLAGEAPQVLELPSLDALLGDDWQLANTDVLGEFYLREYLSLQMDSQTAGQAAAGWGGDYYAVYYQEAEQAVVLALHIVWDTPAEQEEFVNLFETFARQRMGAAADETIQLDGHCWSLPADTLCLFSNEAGTFVVRAPTLDLASAVFEAIE